MFYFYTCMMDEHDLEKLDPKRTNLEEDKIVLEYSKERLRAVYDLYPTKLEQDLELLKAVKDQDSVVTLAIKYRIEQKKILLKLIDIYDNELLKLIKEDIL
jgi:Rubisco LSMT substrate-binding